MVGAGRRGGADGVGRDRQPDGRQRAGGAGDSLFISRGKLAASSAAQVTKIRRIIEDLGCDIATPDEARAMLGLKGGDQVAF